MNTCPHSHATKLVGGIAAAFGLLVLSMEMFAYQIFRFHMWANGGISSMFPTAHDGTARATVANDIISVPSMYVAFALTILVIAIGIVMFCAGMKEERPQ